jgi:hypothetical protein
MTSSWTAAVGTDRSLVPAGYGVAAWYSVRLTASRLLPPTLVAQVRPFEGTPRRKPGTVPAPIQSTLALNKDRSRRARFRANPYPGVPWFPARQEAREHDPAGPVLTLGSRGCSRAAPHGRPTQSIIWPAAIEPFLHRPGAPLIEAVADAQTCSEPTVSLLPAPSGIRTDCGGGADATDAGPGKRCRSSG